MTKLGKAFLWLTVFLAITFAIIYGMQVREALAMDPHSYNCTNDSMMKQVCQDPYGTSFFWSIPIFGITCGPILVLWLVIGVLVLVRRDKKSKSMSV